MQRDAKLSPIVSGCGAVTRVNIGGTHSISLEQAKILAACHANGQLVTSAAKAAGLGADTKRAQMWAESVGVVWPNRNKIGAIKYGAVAPSDLPPMELEPPRAIDCQRLWVTLIHDQWRCALDASTTPWARRDRRDARAWIGTKDFHIVCALAGLDGSAVLDRYLAKLNEENV